MGPPGPGPRARSPCMPTVSVVEQYMAPLLAGNRMACRKLVSEAAARADDARTVYQELLWPAMERVTKLYRSDRINAAAESMATRINRAIADQLQLRLRQSEPNGKGILISSAPGEPSRIWMC